jgi:hypothetical protein
MAMRTPEQRDPLFLETSTGPGTVINQIRPMNNHHIPAIAPTTPQRALSLFDSSKAFHMQSTEPHSRQVFANDSHDLGLKTSTRGSMSANKVGPLYNCSFSTVTKALKASSPSSFFGKSFHN